MTVDPMVRGLRSREAVVGQIRGRIAAARDAVAASVPLSLFEEIEDELAAAVSRECLVLLLIDGSESPDADTLAATSTVARLRDRPGLPFPMLVTDGRFGVVASGELFGRVAEGHGIAFESAFLRHMTLGNFMGNHWVEGREVHAPGPLTERHTFTDFRHAVARATAHLRSEGTLDIRCRATPTAAHPDGNDDFSRAPEREIRGTVVSTHQRLVEPNTASFPGETGFVVMAEEGRVSVGGNGAYREDYEATDVTLVP